MIKSVWSILERPYRKRAVLLLGLMMVGMGLEMLGVGLIIPLMVLITDQDLYRNYPAVIPFLDALGNPNQAQLIIGSTIALIGVYIFKAMFLGFLTWHQARFAFDVQANLSQRIFKSYLRQPYTFHLKHNTSELIRNNVTEVNEFIFRILIPGFSLLSEGVVLIGLSVLLLVVEPLGTLSALGAAGVAGVVYYALVGSRVARWGKQRQYHEGLRVKHLQQGLGAVKDIKLLGREDDFITQYRQHALKCAYVSGRQLALQQFPRLWFEMLAVVGLGALILSMLALGRETGELILVIGLFGVAAFRVLPSINKIMSAIQAIKYGSSTIPIISKELNSTEINSNSKKNTGIHLDTNSELESEICLENISFSYPGASESSLKDISITINKGESVGFVGPSGAGKSTLVDVILGLLSITGTGKVVVDGRDIQDDLRSWQNQVGYVPQSIYLTDDTILRNIAFGISDENIDETAVWRAVKASQLEVFVNEQTDGLMAVVGERGVRLSGGQRQRIGIARALYHDPAVLVLDEATSALDSDTEEGVMQAVEGLHGKKTILIIAHRLSTVSKCDRLFKIEAGHIVESGIRLANNLAENVGV